MRILIVHPSLNPPGGGNCVAAWVVEALRESHELTLLAWRKPELERVNRYYGTSLRRGDFRLRLLPQSLRRTVDALPTPSALLSWSLLARSARRLLRHGDWDLVFSTQNEMGFDRRGIQYIHFPTLYEPRPDCDHRWYHRAFPAGLAAYWRFCRWLGDCPPDSVRRNLSLVNSDWTGRKLRHFYGADSLTVYPPVPGEFPRRPWAEREDGFVCIGRISPEKNLETVVAILAAVRCRGWKIRLHLVGSPDNPAYVRRILGLAARHPWIQLHRDLPRDRMLDLMGRNRYGIHGMVGEHFGIAVAELQRAGCIVFVPDEGGQVEIVGNDERLTYRSPQDAARKIGRVLESEELQASLLVGVAERRDRFTAERFVAQIRTVVGKLSPS